MLQYLLLLLQLLLVVLLVRDAASSIGIGVTGCVVDIRVSAKILYAGYIRLS